MPAKKKPVSDLDRLVKKVEKMVREMIIMRTENISLKAKLETLKTELTTARDHYDNRMKEWEKTKLDLEMEIDARVAEINDLSEEVEKYAAMARAVDNFDDKLVEEYEPMKSLLQEVFPKMTDAMLTMSLSDPYKAAQDLRLELRHEFVLDTLLKT